ncbi:MAG: YidC/Oxa1 family membrane protein insertase [Clostridiaceae bacterium]|nr:YidC/Oxa1 family membrane protein insertase [Clostridiaceae bacterium]
MQKLYEYLGIPFGFVISIFYALTGNYLLSIFFLTLIVRLCLLPASIKQQKSQAMQQRLQPKLRRIREKYGNDQRKIQEETQELYQREGFSAMGGGCLPTLIQFPIMIGLFQVNYHPLSWILKIKGEAYNAIITAFTNYAETVNAAAKAAADAAGEKYVPVINLTRSIYSEVYVLKYWNEFKSGISLNGDIITKIETFIGKYNIFGIFLGDTPDYKHFDKLWLIPVISGIIALGTAVYSLIRQKKNNPEMANNPSMGCMMFSMPVMQIVFAFMFPVIVGVYIILSSLISFVQMIVLNHIYSPKKVLAKTMIDETVYRRSKEENTKKINEFKQD